MNIKRYIFWAIFIVVLGLIIWGVAVSMSKNPSGQPQVGSPDPISAADHSAIFGPKPLSGTTPAKYVELIEYSDFQCPACEAYYPIVKHVLASTTVPVKFAYRHFPLPQHQNARPSAYAAEAASLQGKFWEMYDLIFSNPQQWVDLSDASPVFEGYAERLGLNSTKFKDDVSSDAVRATVDAYSDAANKLGIYQTPTFFINGKMIDNPRSYDEFVSDLQSAAR